MAFSFSLNYLHYYFGNYQGFSNFNISDITQKFSLENQSRIARQRKAATLENASAASDEFGKTLAEMFSPEGMKVREAAIANAHSTIDPVMVGGYSTSQLGSGNREVLVEMTNNIADTILNFQEALDATIGQAYSVIQDPSTLEAYKASVIQQYLNYRNIPAGTPAAEISQGIIRDLLKHNGLKYFHSKYKGIGAYTTALQNMILLAEALPNFNLSQNMAWSTQSNQGVIKGGDWCEFLKIISGKIGGMYSNLKGGGMELAVKVGEESCHQQVSAAIVGSHAAGGHGTETFDPRLEKDARPLQTANVSKGDVMVTVSDGRVAISYSVSVKDYKVRGIDDAGNSIVDVNIVSSKPFLDAATQVLELGSGGMTYLLHVASSHGSGNVSSKDIAAGKVQGDRYTDSEISKKWEELKRAVIVGNFLNFLTGLEIENTLFLVVNGRLLDAVDIVDNVAANPSALTAQQKNLSRSAMVKLNKWVASDDKRGGRYSAKKAVERSNAATPAVISYLNNAKLNINLKLLLA